MYIHCITAPAAKGPRCAADDTDLWTVTYMDRLVRGVVSTDKATLEHMHSRRPVSRTISYHFAPVPKIAGVTTNAYSYLLLYNIGIQKTYQCTFAQNCSDPVLSKSEQRRSQ